jgi:RNA polymerase sigma factor (sigma-70 family)
MKRHPEGEIGDLLEQASWLRGLAGALAQGTADADDLVQETWLAALRAPPDANRPPRPWLSQVLRNVSRMAARAGSRRRRRERELGAFTPTTTDGAQDVLERAEVQRRLADLVMAMDEPYRTAILLRYHEGRQAREIAQMLGLPAGTVRWRISEGIARLRSRLLGETGGDPVRLRGWLLAVVGPPPSPRPTAASAATMTMTIVGSTLATVVGVAIAIWSPRSHRQSGAQQAVITGLGRDTSMERGDDIMRIKTKHAAVLFGTALPALVASAQSGGRELSRDEHIEFCVHRWERMAACKEGFADHFAGKQPPERREAHRLRFIEMATEAGTGPIEPRRQKCAASVDKVQPTMTAAAVSEVERCLAETDCQAMLACMKPILDRAPAKRPPSL